MGKSRRHPQLAVIVFSQLHPDPLAEMWETICGYPPPHQIPHPAHTHQLSLGLANLIVQAAQHAFDRAAMIVLDEVYVKPGGLTEIFWLKLSKKKPRLSPKTLGSIISTSGMEVEITFMQLSRSFNKRNKYLP